MFAPRRLALLLAWVILPGCLVAQTTTFTWTGAAATIFSDDASADASLGGNWLNGVAPISDNLGLLEFGPSAGVSNSGAVSVQLPYSFAVRGLTFSGPRPDYYVYSDDAGTLRLGEGELGSSLKFDGYNYATLKLDSKIEFLANQTWTIDDGTVYALDRISQASGGLSLTKAGNGTLVLNSSTSSFSGGLNLQSGTLYVGASSGVGDSSLITGPVGSGTLTLGDGTTLRTNTYDDVTLHNPIVLGNAVTIGDPAERNSLTLAGAIAPLHTSTTLRVGTDGALFIQGGIADATGGATSLTFTNSYSNENQLTVASTSVGDYFPVVVLSGTNTYTGSTTADNAGVIFLTPGALGQTSSISASSGYVATGYSGGMEAILGKIAAPSAFDGALGFDTHPDLAATPTVFADNVNVASFDNDNGGPSSGFWGIGTMTSATLTGTITPPNGGNYVFGGGSGKLYVQSNLGVPANSTGAGVRVRSLFEDEPLTVWLQGNNSFAGKLYSDHSIVVLDSATALPAVVGTDTGRFQLDSGAYVGYTERFTGVATPADFIARLVTPNYNSDSILGFDSYATGGRTISDPLNLSGLGDIFVGTTTHVHLAGTFTAPSTGKFSVTGVNGGWLTLDTPVLAAGVTSLNVGASTTDLHRRGYVELASGNSTYTGGTTLNSGYLLLGASSTVDGSGTLTVATDYSWDSPATIAATTTGITLHNNLNFSAGTLQFGVPVATDPENAASNTQAQAYTGYGLTLNGNLSGTASMLAFSGNGAFTLNGNNSGLVAHSFQIGSSLSAGTPLVVANTDTALGSTASYVYLGSGADLQFTTSAPTVGNLSGGYTLDLDTNNRSFVALAAGSTLTVNQSYDSTLYANIGGTPASFSGSSTATVNASLVKTGSGDLTLAGINTYTGNTTIKGGLLLAGSSVQRDGWGNIVSGPFGTGTIVLDGGGIGAASGITLENPISFGVGGGTLGGNGTIASAITAGSLVKIAPGNSPGQLTFTNGLTFASSGTASFDISNFAGSAGNGWDRIVVAATGSFALTATVEQPFTIQINSWSTIADNIGALATDFSNPAELAILQTSAAITGFVGDGHAGTSNLVLDTSNFTAYQNGTFSLALSADSKALLLQFTPVPEPSTYALFGFGLLAIGASVWRNKRPRQP